MHVRKIKLVEPVDVGSVNIKKDSYFPNAYIVDLALDSNPDHAWQDIFEGEWRTSRHLWDRKIFIIGDTLRLVTSPNDMAEKLNWVKEIVGSTNKKIEGFNKQTELVLKNNPQTRRTMIEHEETVENIKNALRSVFQR